jgi:hypothetical protein
VVLDPEAAPQNQIKVVHVQEVVHLLRVVVQGVHPLTSNYLLLQYDAFANYFYCLGVAQAVIKAASLYLV